MKIVNLSENVSIIGQYLHEIRDVTVQQDRMRFVKNLERLGAISAYEISKELDFSKTQAHTPLAVADTNTLATQPVIATIIRAGLPPYTGFMHMFDNADSAFMAAYRKLGDDGVMKSVIEYVSSPKLDGRPLIIADTMIATGTTIVDIYDKLMEYGQPSQVFVSGVIVSAPAIEFIKTHIPNVTLYAAVIDDILDDRFFIVPGLGDAGDISYGAKHRGPIE
jgi:uracil phosphoribosyltransferase